MQAQGGEVSPRALEPWMPSGSGAGCMRNYDATFRHMAYRRLQRQIHGIYSKPRRGRDALWIFLFVALEVGLASVSFTNGVSVKFDITSNLLALLVNMVALYVALSTVVSMFRWAIFWLAAGSATMVLITFDPRVLFWRGGEVVSFADMSTWVGSLTAVLIFVSLLVGLLRRHFYPLAMRRGYLCFSNLTSLYRIRPIAQGRYSYRLGWVGCSRKHTFGYVGEVDELGRPHGVGTWTDDADHGESLQGLWREGLPVGPFRATEFGSDYRFSNVRLAFMHNRAEPRITESWWWPRYCEQGLCWGVVSVECSIAGGWFKNLPAATLLSGPQAGRSASWCMRQLIALRQQPPPTTSLMVNLADGMLRVSGFEMCGSADDESVTIRIQRQPPAASAAHVPPTEAEMIPTPTPSSPKTPRALDSWPALASTSTTRTETPAFPRPTHQRTPTWELTRSRRVGAEDEAVPTVLLGAEQWHEAHSNQTLSVDGWDETPLPPSEAILFCPGFNASAEEALLALGQLLALGDFPPHIKAFVFSWPGGRELTYFPAMKCASSEKTQTDLASMITSLIEAGITHFHLLTHSAGALVLLSALSKLEEIFTSLRASVDSGHRQSRASVPRISTVLLLSPDYPLRRFVDSDFARLRKLCNHITIYSDAADGALFYSQIFNRGQALGKHPFGLVHRASPEEAAAVAAAVAVASVPPLEAVPPLESVASARRSKLENPKQSLLAQNGLQRGVLGGSYRLAETVAETVASTVGNAVGGTQWLRSRLAEAAVFVLPQGDLASRVQLKGVPLDLDVIDTSWMDSNVQKLRHSYFNVNRWLIDDIREVITTKRRACQRTGRMIHRRGNVWSFLAAPKYIVS
ncbi:hypothetical protein AB1Y20_022295 [Prymnesium parvum]|uniref:GPI inositol-deacylase n=1 Tax=Prymnesium parvum TaxID=97485 RepID=A0AB34JHZ6_PRYPA